MIFLLVLCMYMKRQWLDSIEFFFPSLFYPFSFSKYKSIILFLSVSNLVFIFIVTICFDFFNFLIDFFSLVSPLHHLVSFNIYIKFGSYSFIFFLMIFVFNFIPQYFISNYFYIKFSPHSFYYYFFVLYFIFSQFYPSVFC